MRPRLGIRTRFRELGERVRGETVRRFQSWIARHDYYSPLPDFDAVGQAVWDRVSPMLGVDLDVGRQFAWAEEHLRGYATEFSAPPHGDPTQPRFYLHNQSFQAGDAEVLYAIVRSAKPSRIIEVGSGFSTMVMAEAVVANRAEGHITHLHTFDPYPAERIAGHAIDGLGARSAVRAQDIPLAEFESLAEGDILFVDSTHTVKIGSEVNRLILDVLPSLAPGVYVHFHDILLPYEYPRWLIERWGAWNEQYLLHAFLINNSRYEILAGLQAMARSDPERLAGIAPYYNNREHFPMSFWLRSK
jgi:hypothetical protein